MLSDAPPEIYSQFIKDLTQKNFTGKQFRTWITSKYPGCEQVQEILEVFVKEGWIKFKEGDNFKIVIVCGIEEKPRPTLSKSRAQRWSRGDKKLLGPPVLPVEILSETLIGKPNDISTHLDLSYAMKQVNIPEYLGTCEYPLKSCRFINNRCILALYQNTGNYIVHNIPLCYSQLISNQQKINLVYISYPKIATVHQNHLQIYDVESSQLYILGLPLEFFGAKVKKCIFSNSNYLVIVAYQKIMVWTIGEFKPVTMISIASSGSSEIFYPTQSLSRFNWPLLLLASGTHYQLWNIETVKKLADQSLAAQSVNRYAASWFLESSIAVSSIEDLSFWISSKEDQTYKQMIYSNMGVTVVHRYSIPSESSRMCNSFASNGNIDYISETESTNPSTVLWVAGDLQGFLIAFDANTGVKLCTLDTKSYVDPKNITRTNNLTSVGNNRINSISSQGKYLYVAHENCYVTTWTLELVSLEFRCVNIKKTRSPILHFELLSRYLIWSSRSEESKFSSFGYMYLKKKTTSPKSSVVKNVGFKSSQPVSKTLSNPSSRRPGFEKISHLPKPENHKYDLTSSEDYSRPLKSYSSPDGRRRHVFKKPNNTKYKSAKTNNDNHLSATLPLPELRTDFDIPILLYSPSNRLTTIDLKNNPSMIQDYPISARRTKAGRVKRVISGKGQEDKERDGLEDSENIRYKEGCEGKKRVVIRPYTTDYDLIMTTGSRRKCRTLEITNKENMINGDFDFQKFKDTTRKF